MFKRKKKNNEFDSYEDDIMNLVTKEKEIMSSYETEESENNDYDVEIIESFPIDETTDENTEIIYEDFDESPEELPKEPIEATYENYEEPIEEEPKETFEEYEPFTTDEYDSYQDDEYESYMEDEYETSQVKEKKYKKTINIIFTVVIIMLAMIAIDVISVARYDVGPFFAIPVQKFKDGGSKAYYGLGYKVIKYKQLQGRRDKEIGLWNLKYNIEPITIEDVDLAIEMQGNEVKTYKKYYKRFVRITSKLKSVDKKNNKITVSYQDEGGKYTLDMVCSMASKESKLDNLEKNKEITFIGTLTDFKAKSKKTPNTLYIENCFAEQ